jgi:phosphoribosylformimino-5-aminoimidazole carboxamide ribotide isomerase
MIVMPAIDLTNGGCAQPLNGRERSPRVVDAMEMVRSWTHVGFRHLHVVDVDAATNAGSNINLIEEIIRDGSLDVQVGGGVRSTEKVQRLFEAGAARIVVGSRAIEEPEWLADLAHLFPSVIVLATDVREGRVMTRGRLRRPPLDVVDLVRDVSDLPIAGVLVTPTHLAQTMEGRDLNLLEDVVDASDAPVFVAGGVTTTSDLRALEHRGVGGVVIGSALHGNGIDARAVAQEFSE